VTETRLHISGLHCSFRSTDGERVEAIRGVDLSLKPNEFVAIIGPSGCGKSTLFNAIAGLVQPDTGAIRLDGGDIVGRPGHVAYMMQRDLLLDWRTVLQNVTLGPELAGAPIKEARAHARMLLKRFNLDGFEDAYPSMLSGGMRQRAALLRTILCERSVILLDEPFGALDALTRASLHEWLLGIQREFQRTMVLITHDPEEAVFLADRVYVSTPRPMRVAGVVDINLPRFRTHEVKLTPEFAAHERAVLALLRNEAQPEMAGAGARLQ
jgi:ABC-type nitrate/sulfonate/bicarbonate transport system ATPase subunit